MPTVKDFYSAIDSLAPFSLAEPWDNVGLLAGAMELPVTKAIVALDATPDVIGEAVSQGAELIITHHPVIFGGLKALPKDSLPWLLARAGLSVICAHTNYDIAENGVSDILAACLGLTDIKPAGTPPVIRIGMVSEAITPSALAIHAKNRLSAPGVRYIAGSRPVKTIAVCGGSGGDYLDIALESGADAYITGECKHHIWLEAARQGITLVEAGHFHTENPAMAPLAEQLAALVPSAEVMLSGVCSDGIVII